MSEPERSANGLTLADVISVAEHAMERGGLAGKTIHVPTGHVDDPAYQEAIRPLNEWVRSVVGTTWTKILTSEYMLAEAGNPQAFVTACGSIVVRPVTNEMVILHECAHLLEREKGNWGDGPLGGHTHSFAQTARELYATHISPKASDVFWNLVKTSGL